MRHARLWSYVWERIDELSKAKWFPRLINLHGGTRIAYTTSIVQMLHCSQNGIHSKAVVS